MPLKAHTGSVQQLRYTIPVRKHSSSTQPGPGAMFMNHELFVAGQWCLQSFGCKEGRRQRPKDWWRHRLIKVG